MSIYKKPRVNYRKIYTEYHGPIPVDEEGRTYDIHHIDSNHSNNDPANLKAVTIQEHYLIHYSQGDYGACARLAKRANLSPSEISLIVSIQQQKRVENGTHHFLGGKIQGETSRRLVKEGTHPFLGGTISREITRKRLDNGTHHFLGGDLQRKNVRTQIENGTHPFIGDKNPSYKLMEQGTHNFLTRNPSTIMLTCPHCGKTAGKPNMGRWHFDKCKSKENP